MFIYDSDLACSPALLIERLPNFSLMLLLAHLLMSKSELYIIPGCKSIKPGKKVEKIINLKSKIPNFLKNPGKKCKGFSNNVDNNTFILFLIGIKNGENKSPGKDEKFIIKIIGTHLFPSFKFIFFTCGPIPPWSIRLHARLRPKIVAKPRHSQYLLIPGRASTSGCARGGAFLKKIPNSKFQITNKSQIPKGVAPPANKEFQTSALMSIITVSLSNICLLLLLIEESFFNQLKDIVITSAYRAVSGPGFISPKKYPGLLLRGFLFFLATKARRHKGFIYNKTFCVTLWLCVLVANFTAAKKKLKYER